MITNKTLARIGILAALIGSLSACTVVPAYPAYSAPYPGYGYRSSPGPVIYYESSPYYGHDRHHHRYGDRDRH